MEQQNESDQPQKLYDTRSVASKTKTSRSSRSSTSSAATKARASAEAALVEAKYAAREAEMMKAKAKIEAEAAQRKAELEASLYVLKIERSATAAAAEAAVYEGAAAVEGSSLEDLAQIPPEDTAQHTSEYVKAHYVTPDAQQPAPVPQQPLTTSTPAPRASLPAPPSSVQWYPLPGTVTNQPTTFVNAPCHSSRSLSLSNRLDNRLRERSTQQRAEPLRPTRRLQIPPPGALPAPLLPPCSSSGCACTVGVLHTISRCPVRPARQRSSSTRDIPQLLALPAPTTPAASSALVGRLQVEGTISWAGEASPTTALIDSGADENFIDSGLVSSLNIPTVELVPHKNVRSLDEHHLACITHQTRNISLVLSGNHHKVTNFFLMPSRSALLVLGLPWHPVCVL
uniref:proline-rich protein 36-like isoform X1 n=1 Tax=Doryrhamphus excisus TaxID=161450 RepID=UPI0025AE690C|nr:proline-rich protein 36-like isoform X1 [Doryrhamphus excisus]XP_057920026.1 proline-rich protein 36-like isoform X1 [Doryrhamphus excisus]XP_057920027.1 proline-rich protein 36-like isoform X1 [Doryrhamphus excisus]XP_057920029.1 proline-rich protein 36-like isoform X1 [Doryrhamphus excisus]